MHVRCSPGRREAAGPGFEGEAFQAQPVQIGCAAGCEVSRGIPRGCAPGICLSAGRSRLDGAALACAHSRSDGRRPALKLQLAAPQLEVERGGRQTGGPPLLCGSLRGAAACRAEQQGCGSGCRPATCRSCFAPERHGRMDSSWHDVGGRPRRWRAEQGPSKGRASTAYLREPVGQGAGGAARVVAAVRHMVAAARVGELTRSGGPPPRLRRRARSAQADTPRNADTLRSAACWPDAAAGLLQQCKARAPCRMRRYLPQNTAAAASARATAASGTLWHCRTWLGGTRTRRRCRRARRPPFCYCSPAATC